MTKLIVPTVKEYPWIYPNHQVMPLISSIGQSIVKTFIANQFWIILSLYFLPYSQQSCHPWWEQAETISATNIRSSSWWLFKSYSPRSISCHRGIEAMQIMDCICWSELTLIKSGSSSSNGDWWHQDKNPSLVHMISLSLLVRISLSFWRSYWSKPIVNWMCTRSMDPDRFNIFTLQFIHFLSPAIWIKIMRSM